MEELIKKVFEEKMTNGTFERIVGEKFEGMITSICDDLTSWSSPIKKQMEEKIKPLMSEAIENSDFNEYTIKLVDIINQSLNQSSLNQYRIVAENLKKILGYNTIDYKFGETVKISTLFEKYVDFVEETLEESDFDSDEINTDEGTKRAYVECSYYIDNDNYDEKPSYFNNKRDNLHIIFTNDKAESDEDIATKTRIEFDIYEDYEGSKYINFNSDFKISDLRIIPGFILDLMDIRNKFCNISIDSEKEDIDAEFEFEWNYS